MIKPSTIVLFAALLGFAVLVSATAASAEIEGALQYPPREIGEDAQPPPPAMMLPTPVSPRRLELGLGGSSLPPSKEQHLLHSPAHQGGFQSPPPTGTPAVSGISQPLRPGSIVPIITMMDVVVVAV